MEIRDVHRLVGLLTNSCKFEYHDCSIQIIVEQAVALDFVFIMKELRTEVQDL
jgi:hypothetical protein